MPDEALPKFHRYHAGPWPYDYDDGVGLAISGQPTDAFKLLELLQDVSCSPIAAHRILDDLERGLTRYTTVQSNLDFNEIGDALRDLGVTMEVIPPRKNMDTIRYDGAALALLQGRPPNLEDFSPAERLSIEQRYQQTLASLARNPEARHLL